MDNRQLLIISDSISTQTRILGLSILDESGWNLIDHQSTIRNQSRCYFCYSPSLIPYLTLRGCYAASQIRLLLGYD